jgi:hypothetical protein
MPQQLSGAGLQAAFDGTPPDLPRDGAQGGRQSLDRAAREPARRLSRR